MRIFLVAEALLIVVLAGFTTNSMLAGREAAKAPQAAGTFEAYEKGNSEIVRLSKAVVNSENVLKEANSPPDEALEKNIAGRKPGAIASEVDFARIHPLSTSVIAGISTPKSKINILADGKVIATVKTGSIGEWVLVTTYNFERAKPNLEVRSSPNSPGLSETSKAEPPIPKTVSARSAKSDTSLPIDASAKPTVSQHRAPVPLTAHHEPTVSDYKPAAPAAANTVSAAEETTRSAAALQEPLPPGIKTVRQDPAALALATPQLPARVVGKRAAAGAPISIGINAASPLLPPLPEKLLERRALPKSAMKKGRGKLKKSQTRSHRRMRAKRLGLVRLKTQAGEPLPVPRPRPRSRPIAKPIIQWRR